MNKFPFTATQWQELEHQALIFKYMVSGIPIPPDLLYTLRRNYLDSSNKLLISHHSQHVGWNFFQAGLGRKIDPEPGRCRRTDGKKWRCSKEAFPDSKYCERHMHRGKNRSRKPVEVFKTQHNTPPPPPVSNNNDNNGATSSPVLTNLHHFDQNPPPFTYHHQCHSSSDNNNNTASFVFDSDLRHRYVYGVKDEVDEHAFFSQEPSRRTSLRGFSSNSATPMDDTWQLTPLAISCSNHSSSSKLQSGGGHYYHHDKNDMEEEEEDGTQKTTRHFFDEWPMKQKDSPWLDVDDKSVSTTQLSISMPKASHDFPIFTSRTR